MLDPNSEPPVKPLTWGELKEFANKLTPEQLLQEVIVPQDETSCRILYASELGEEQYYFIEDEDTITKDGFDKLYHFEGKYETLEDAMENEEHIIVPADRVYLFDDTFEIKDGENKIMIPATLYKKVSL